MKRTYTVLMHEKQAESTLLTNGVVPPGYGIAVKLFWAFLYEDQNTNKTLTFACYDMRMKV